MSLVNVTISGAKAGFFDSPKIIAKLEKGQRRALSRCGAYVRQTAKNSLKYKPVKSDAPAGSPPFVHRSERFTRTTVNKKTGASKTRPTSPLKELLFFSYDEASKSVVIGPAIFRQASRKNYLVPSVLEMGGTVPAKQRGNRIVPTQIAPHPYMNPALRKELPKFSQTFANIVKR